MSGPAPSADVRATCPGCGAEVTHAKTPDGEDIPLEKWTDSTGSMRYRIVDFGPPLTVEAVSDHSPIDAYPDHRKDCPHGHNGLRP